MSTIHPGQTGRKTMHAALKADPKSSTTHSLPADMRRERFLKRHGVAALLNVHPKTLLKMWLKGEGPQRRVLSERVDGSTVGDVEDFLAACKVG
jgi:hypothetical protein